MKEKLKTVYVCSECGETYHKWQGQCSSCRAWNTLEEDVVVQQSKSAAVKDGLNFTTADTITFQQLHQVDADDKHIRIKTGIGELDRVLGGGIVQGAGMLIGGEPGAGKSTLLLQICGNICNSHKVVYISGEESVNQIKLRANRLGIDGKNIAIASETDVLSICKSMEEHKPDIMVIDSIQTMNYSEISSSPGSVSQVRESTALLLGTAKKVGTSLFIVGHVNKDGAIAGPKVMEHIVDTVLYFEGDKTLPYKILRASKNRYGSTNEIGMFDMTAKGIVEITNPSMLLLEGRSSSVSGSCVTCVIEGTRPILTEIQALATKTGFGTPRRASSGIDYNRLNLLLAVMEKRAGYYMQNMDIYVNVVGGLELDETSIDLAVILSVISGLGEKSIPDDMVVMGEVGLGGEVRAVTHIDSRLREAERLGFKRAIIPYHCMNKINTEEYGLEIYGVSNIRQAIKLI
ncbi:MAG: DNA repair protein RadA [Oscillospiraceae bacterium]|nr:DNA repair protein RadA [Oscillospiraceae bacterium]